MEMLSPRIEFKSDESVLGYVARLAGFHAGIRSGEFLSDLGINLYELARSEPEGMNKLAAYTGVPIKALEANAPRGLGHRGYQLRGEFVTAEFLASPQTVFCPACLADDDRSSGGVPQARRHLWHWQLRAVRTCHVHGLPLVSRKAKNTRDRFHELAVVVPEVSADLEQLVPKRDPRQVSPLQQYVLKRLDGLPGSVWLDRQGLEQGVRASEMVGVLVAYGATPNLDKFTDDDWDHAGAVGYSYTSQGEAGIRQALSEAQKSFKYNGSNPGPQAVFGRLYQWLRYSKSNKSVGDIKWIVRDHILDTMPVRKGATVLGKELSERRLHTCASLARETKLDPRTLRGMLIAKGLLPEDASEAGYYVFDSARGLEVANSMGRLVAVTGIPKALGCSRPLANQLISERILTPIVSELTHAKGHTKKGFDSLEVERLLHCMEVRSKSVSDLPAGMVDLATAAMKSNAPAADIVHLILGGFLSNVYQVEGFEGLSAIHVDPVETKDAVARIMVGLAPKEAFIRLGITERAGWELIDASPDRVHLPTLVIPARDGDHVIRRVRVEDMEAFFAEFTTEKRIREALEIGSQDLKCRMKAAKAKPAYLKSEIGVRIFRRSELPAPFQV